MFKDVEICTDSISKINKNVNTSKSRKAVMNPHIMIIVHSASISSRKLDSQSKLGVKLKFSVDDNDGYADHGGPPDAPKRAPATDHASVCLVNPRGCHLDAFSSL